MLIGMQVISNMLRDPAIKKVELLKVRFGFRRKAIYLPLRTDHHSQGRASRVRENTSDFAALLQAAAPVHSHANKEPAGSVTGGFVTFCKTGLLQLIRWGGRKTQL